MLLAIIIGILTIIEVIVCHFTLWWLIALVPRVLFTLRLIGANFKVKTLCIVECVAFALNLVFNILFHGDKPMPWLRLGVFAVVGAISCAIMWFDSIYYAYIIEDDDVD